MRSTDEKLRKYISITETPHPLFCAIWKVITSLSVITFWVKVNWRKT